ncbi:hypothetical protein TruAng_001937 [Truncatella angustata]|nr:hypothetical protein TruAng_001937 [Truncatella angustata]
MPLFDSSSPASCSTAQRLSDVSPTSTMATMVSDMANNAPDESTAVNEHQEKHDVATELNYWDDPGDGSRPTPIYIGKGHITNERPHRPHRFVVSDVSGDEDRYTLDGHGFQYIRHESKEKDFVDEQRIRAEYYPECAQALQDVTGASRIHVFNHKVRRGPTHWHHLGLKNLANRGPVTKTHVDQSYDGAEKRLRWELPEEADELVKKRYQIINVWRPIKTIYKDPVAVANANSVPDADLVGAEMIEDGFRGESWVAFSQWTAGLIRDAGYCEAAIAELLEEAFQRPDQHPRDFDNYLQSLEDQDDDRRTAAVSARY